MSLYINEQQPEDAPYDFRVLVLEQPEEGTPIAVESSDIKEKLLEGIDSFTGINEFFDAFDQQVAYPNEGRLKYDVGSDGFIVIVVDGAELRQKVTEFIDEYLKKCAKNSEAKPEEDADDDADDDDGPARKRR